MLDVQRGGSVARVFLDRPAKANALGSELLERLAEALESLHAEPDLRAVVLAGHGKSFCGGADVDELRALDETTAPAFIGRVHRACAAVRRLGVPVVARLHGAVVGAGLELAASCDLRIAAQRTRFAMPEVRLGIPSVVEAALLPRLVGSGRAAWLVLTGQAIDAERAYAWGLVESICPGDALDAEVATLIENLLAADPAALRMQKTLLQTWEEQPLASSVRASIDFFADAYRKVSATERRR